MGCRLRAHSRRTWLPSIGHIKRCSALGRRDHMLTRDESLAHARLIVDATELPVSADLGKGFGDAPEVVAETIRFAAEVGLVGCTIEDATGNEDRPLYDFGLAVERICGRRRGGSCTPVSLHPDCASAQFPLRLSEPG